MGGVSRWTWRPSDRGATSVPVLLSLLVGGCGVVAGGSPVPEDPCRIHSRGEGEGVVPVIGVVDPVELARRGAPRSDGEGLLFATVHPPLARLDCSGALRPGVAAGWEPLPAVDGAVGWRLGIPGPRERGDAVARGLAGPAPEGGVLVTGVERTAAGVVVRLRGEGLEADGPRVLAERRLVPVAGGSGGWGSPLSGLRLEPVAAPGPGATLHLLAGDGAAERLLALVRVVPGGDARDLLDDGADLVLTRDPRAVAWASSREGLRVVELPPDRVYRMALPGGGPGELPRELSAGLVRDVVPLGRIPSGGSPPPTGTCPATPPPLPSAPYEALRPRVVHPLGDVTARALAERMAALAGPGGAAPLAALAGRAPGSGSPPVLQVVGLDPAGFEAALREGRDVAYLFPEPVRPAAPCNWAASRFRRIPWLHRGSLLSLVEVGPRALMAEGAPALAVDGTGAVRMVFPGRTP